MELDSTPHGVHIFCCTNQREDKSKSCGDSGDMEHIADELKQRFKKNNIPVRISRSSCLGPCAQGPNIMIYPQQIWLKNVQIGDVDAIEAKVHQLIGC